MRTTRAPSSKPSHCSAVYRYCLPRSGDPTRPFTSLYSEGSAAFDALCNVIRYLGPWSDGAEPGSIGRGFYHHLSKLELEAPAGFR